MTPISLTQSIADLLLEAERHPEQPQQQTLRRGLVITIKISDGKTWLSIARADTVPSLIEWRTVINHWPYPVRVVNPAYGITADGLYSLYASWPSGRKAS